MKSNVERPFSVGEVAERFSLWPVYEERGGLW